MGCCWSLAGVVEMAFIQVPVRPRKSLAVELVSNGVDLASCFSVNSILKHSLCPESDACSRVKGSAAKYCHSSSGGIFQPEGDDRPVPGTVAVSFLGSDLLQPRVNAL